MRAAAFCSLLVVVACSSGNSKRHVIPDGVDGGSSDSGRGGAGGRSLPESGGGPGSGGDGSGGTASLRDARADVELPGADASKDASVEAGHPTDASVSPGVDAGPLPLSCAEILRRNPTAADGDQTLYVARDPAKPWTAFCTNMFGAPDGALPKEYLSLVNTGPGYNYSQYAAGGAATGTTVTTTFTKVRLDPVTLAIDGSDRTFATSTGLVYHDGISTEAIPWMPYGVAMACDNATTLGTANIDLGGTPFVLDPAHPICVKTFGPGGYSTTSPDGKTASLVGEGYCGWTSAGCENPPNATVEQSLRDDRTVLAYGPLADAN